MKALIVALLLAGCVTPRLHQDPSPSAADSGYPTAEFVAQGRVFHGLGEVLVRTGEPYDDIALEVQGYFDGVIRVDSDRCNLHEVWNYTNSEKKRIVLKGLARDTCVVDIVVVPTYPDQVDQAVRAYELKGQLVVKVLGAGLEWRARASRVRAGASTTLELPAAAPSRVVFRGCNSTFDQKLTPVSGQIVVNSKEVVGPAKAERCILEGFVLAAPAPILRVLWRIWGYDATFTPLAAPVIRTEKEKLLVQADDSVTAIFLDDEVVIDAAASFDFDAEANHTLRILTVKGRSVVCTYDARAPAWACQG